MLGLVEQVPDVDFSFAAFDCVGTAEPADLLYGELFAGTEVFPQPYDGAASSSEDSEFFVARWESVSVSLFFFFGEGKFGLLGFRVDVGLGPVEGQEGLSLFFGVYDCSCFHCFNNKLFKLLRNMDRA